MELFKLGFLRFTVIDILDILIVAYFLYRVMLLMKGTWTAQIVIGILTLAFVGFIAYWFQLNAVKWLFSNIATVGVIIFVVVFQPELRRALARVGRSRLARFFTKIPPTKVTDEVVGAAERLSAKRHGALIVFERQNALDHIIETGKIINSKLSADLLLTIFTPHTPLHDGAAVVRRGEIVACGCTLPLSKNPKYLRVTGTRHTAAVGMTEETDAIVIVVSEESGKISIAHHGVLHRDVDQEFLSSTLRRHFETE